MPRPVEPHPTIWYRSDAARATSVHGRANPWYRRIARGLIALCLVGALGVGLYIAGQALRDWLGRDRLPALGVDAADLRSTTFLVTSTAPAPEVTGTITLDTQTGAFEFAGTPGTAQQGIEMVSPDGTTVFVRSRNGWRPPGASEQPAADVLLAVRYLIDADTTDVLLPNRLRDGFVTLVERTTLGADENELTRYEVDIDTARFADRHPLDWTTFRRTAIPGAVSVDAARVTFETDRGNVLVSLADDSSHWRWQRLAYTAEPFRPLDPRATGQVTGEAGSTGSSG